MKRTEVLGWCGAESGRRDGGGFCEREMEMAVVNKNKVICVRVEEGGLDLIQKVKSEKRFSPPCGRRDCS